MTRLHAPVQAVLAAASLGAAIGLCEASYLALSAQSSWYAAAYAWWLYGLLGAGAGLGVGALWAVVSIVRELPKNIAAGVAAGMALLGLGAAIGRYLLNRDVFAEQGVPLWALGGLLLVLVVGAVLLVVASKLVGGKPVVRLGALAGLSLVPGVLLSVAVPLMGQGTAALPNPRSPNAALSDKPDVLFIMVDTLRADHVVDSGLHTPALDALRADSVTFDNAWSAASWTRAAGASLWTSRFPAGHGTETKSSALPPGVDTWSEALQAEGVVTGALINNINMTAGFGFDQGFDHFVYAAPEYPLGADASVFGLTMYKLVHRVEGRLRAGGVSRYYQPADVVLDDAMAFVRSQEGGRSALFVHLMEPHDPYFEHPWTRGGKGDYGVTQIGRAEHPEPDPSEAPLLRDLYAQEVLQLDRELGRFFDELRAAGRYDSTLIVLTSDHGEEFFEHGGWWHGDTLHAEQTHVPLLVKLPGQALGGTRASWQVRSVDVAPTIAAQLGVSAPTSWEGQDLFTADARAALRSTDPSPVDEQALQALDPMSRCRLERRHPLDRDVLMQEDFEGNRLLTLRREGMSWHRANAGNPRGLPEQALFDVLDDPTEQRELIAAGAAVCSRYAEDWSVELGTAATAIADATAAESGGTVNVGYTDAQRAELCALGYLRGDECR